jgi:hypothetical protein
MEKGNFLTQKSLPSKKDSFPQNYLECNHRV